MAVESVCHPPLSIIFFKGSPYSNRSSAALTLNEDRLANITPEEAASLVREMEDPLSIVTPIERARLVTLLFKQVQKVNDLPCLLFEKFEAHAS